MRHPWSSALLFSRLALKILVILLLCGVLPALVAGLYALRRDENVREQHAHDVLTMELVRCKSDASAWLGERLRDATTWASAYIVLDALETMSRPDADAAAARQTLSDYLQWVLGNTRVYESLFVVDRQGRILAETRSERVEQELRKFLLDNGGLEQGAVRLIRHSEVLSGPTLLVLYPIRGRRSAPMAFVALRVDLDKLKTLLRPVDGDVKVAFTLLDRAGGAFVSPDSMAEPAQARAPTLDLSRFDVYPCTSDEAHAALCIHTRLPAPLEGYLLATTGASGGGLLGTSPWRVLRVALVAIVIMVLAFVWATRGVLRPILFLSEGARRLSAGDLNVFLPVRGRDEIAALTTTFNEMIRRLREGREAIEDAHDDLARANEDLRAANQTLEALAITDGLTGLYNHRHFQDTLEREIRRCDREGKPLSLLMLDLDHFKQFNDRWGHTEGDAALRRVAGQIMTAIRASDSAFRYGGEELSVLLPGCMKEQAREVAEKLRLAVASGSSRKGPTVPRLTVSIGVATAPEDAREGRGLVDAADAALYGAKARGRNCVVLAGAEDSASLSEA